MVDTTVSVYKQFVIFMNTILRWIKCCEK